MLDQDVFEPDKTEWAARLVFVLEQNGLLYRLTRLSFGSENASGTFHRAIDAIVVTVKWQLVLVYLADIAIFSETPEEHISYVKQVQTLLQRAVVSLMLKNDNFP